MHVIRVRWWSTALLEAEPRRYLHLLLHGTHVCTWPHEAKKVLPPTTARLRILEAFTVGVGLSCS